jgi:hypothetical protein
VAPLGAESGWFRSRVVGEAEVVVAAEADDRAPVEMVADALALGDLGRRCVSVPGVLDPRAVPGGGDPGGSAWRLTGADGCGSYCGTVAGGNLQELLGPHAAAIGLDELPWGRLEGLGRQWLRFGRAMNLSGARDLPALAEQVAEGLEVVALATRLGCESGQRWIDIGSGAGFPGLIVAACLPVEVVLVEPRERRASFLELMLGELGVKGRVVRGRLGGARGRGWKGESEGGAL